MVRIPAEVYDMLRLLAAVGLPPGGSSTVHIYTQTIHRTTQLTTLFGRLSGIRTQSGQTNWEDCGPCPVFASYTLAFALQLRKKHGKASVRAVKDFPRFQIIQAVLRPTQAHIERVPVVLPQEYSSRSVKMITRRHVIL